MQCIGDDWRQQKGVHTGCHGNRTMEAEGTALGPNSYGDHGHMQFIVSIISYLMLQQKWC